MKNNTPLGSTLSFDDWCLCYWIFEAFGLRIRTAVRVTGNQHGQGRVFRDAYNRVISIEDWVRKSNVRPEVYNPRRQNAGDD